MSSTFKVKTLSAFARNASYLFGGTSGGGVYRSSDNGSSWAQTNVGLADTFVTSLLVKNSYLFAGTSAGGIFRSTNNGTSWIPKITNLGSLNIETLGLKDTLMFAGTSDAGIFRSTDNGDQWAAAATGITATRITAITASGNAVVAATPDSGIFRSTNDGLNWTQVNNGLGQLFSMNCFATSGPNLFVGSSGRGVFYTTDNGANWTEASTGLPHLPILSMDVHGSELYAGTLGLGVWRRPLSEIVTVVPLTSSTKPTGFFLEQNYPNPFNNSTTISYIVSTRSHVSLTVFDVLGREIDQLVNDVHDPGTYRVQFDGSELSSGVYYYRLAAGTNSVTRKFLFLR